MVFSRLRQFEVSPKTLFLIVTLVGIGLTYNACFSPGHWWRKVETGKVSYNGNPYSYSNYKVYRSSSSEIFALSDESNQDNYLISLTEHKVSILSMDEVNFNLEGLLYTRYSLRDKAQTKDTEIKDANLIVGEDFAEFDAPILNEKVKLRVKY